MALKELQTELQEVFDLETSLQTISRTLKRAGYTMKAVHVTFHLINTITSILCLDHTACFGAK